MEESQLLTTRSHC